MCSLIKCFCLELISFCRFPELAWVWKWLQVFHPYFEGCLKNNFFIWIWSDVWPSMVTHTRNSCSAFYPSKCTHTQQWTRTHCEHTPRAVGSHLCCGAREQLGVQCLVQGSHLSNVIEGGESAVHSLTIPARTRDSNPQPRITSPTFYPLGHNCPKRRSCIYIAPFHCSRSLYIVPYKTSTYPNRQYKQIRPNIATLSKMQIKEIHYIAKSIGSPPSNERLDYFSNFHEYKS